ncbi:MAG TPA: sigma-70 family RNA polymerase sigma factor [Phycisphaerae bacterium]|nr:sigma-70 family RNA polymerase sigma factor [Phycisphaerae bacterium]
MSHASEEELIAQAIAGNQVAIHQLLMRHHDQIAAMLAKKIPPDLAGLLAAEDICQEAYVVAVRELASFQPRGKNAFFKWLLTIAERKLIDAIRALRAAKRGGGKKALELPARSDASSIAGLLEHVAIHERTPSRSAADHEIVSAVQNALAGLKEDYRTAIHCRYIEGLSAAETAARMGRSEGAVLKLCERALQQLAESIGDASRFFSRKP